MINLSFEKTKAKLIKKNIFKIIEQKTGMTLRKIIEGDRVCRNLSPQIVKLYIYDLYNKIAQCINKNNFSFILGSNDGVTGALSLAAAKEMKIPWVALQFTTIPHGLIGFQKSLCPADLAPVAEKWKQAELQVLAKKTINDLYLKNKKLGYKAPFSLSEIFNSKIYCLKNKIYPNKEYKLQKISRTKFNYYSIQENIKNFVKNSLQI